MHEIKHDGYRLLVRHDGDKVTLYTWRGYDWSGRYTSISASALKLRRQQFLIDGEAIIRGEDAIADFSKMRGRRESAEVILYAFDLLEIDGKDIRSESLSKRNAQLKRMIGKQHGIVYNEHLAFSGQLVFENACRLGLEGIVSKRIDSQYQSGRSKDWLKTKNPDRAAAKRHAEGKW